MDRKLCICVLLSAWTLLPAGAGHAAEFEVGGPLAGVKLPLYPTRHGEPAGYPGSVPALAAKARQQDASSTDFTPQGQAPEPLLYDGSVEHWRTYFQKYLPIKSFFDRQSLVKAWLAGDLPGVAAGRVERYREPVYWVPRHGTSRPTGLFRKPVPVVRLRPKSSALRLDLGELPVGMYALRVIGAVETRFLQRHRKPLYLRVTVNDGLDGRRSAYALRAGYVDEFYSIAEVYFHAPVQRRYSATVAVEKPSLVDLLVHTIDLHDVLAGSERRAIKTRATLGQKSGPVEPVPNTPERLERDKALWESFLPINAQLGYVFGGGGDDAKDNRPNIGAAGKSAAEIEAEHGVWQADRSGRPGAFLVNRKLNLTYSMDDFRAHKPLPDPYPFKDNGGGVFTPAARAGGTPQNWFPVARGLRQRARLRRRDDLRAWIDRGDVQAGRDAAVMLIRAAYDFPATDRVANSLSAVMLQPGAYGRDLRCRRRSSAGGGLGLVRRYDQLFPLIRGNEALAQSIGRFVPSVKTSQDLIRLLDVYVLQAAAKRHLRYHVYSSNEPARILTPVMVMGDPSVTDPWMEWLFSRTFLYPLPPSGLQDLIITGNDRDGIGYIGSFYYSQIEEASAKAESVARYIEAGGNPAFDLRDPKRFAKVAAAPYWFLRTRMAGLYFPRIGDVAGPDKSYGSWFSYVVSFSRRGWRWTKDPQFAFVLKHHGGRKGWTDAEWAAIEAAAARQKRAPWLTARSRFVANWFGLLESGVEHDDFRFRRNVFLRIGQGWGHQHDDTLDLQIHAHGYPMTIDAGQRGGYSKPNDRTRRIHNIVEVDGKDWLGHSWLATLTDSEGARYMAAEATPPASHPDVSLYRRQVALIDVDAGRGARPLSPGARADPDVTTPNSYVFDVVRVQGGKVHTYCFHGPIDDEMTVTALNRRSGSGLPEADRAYLRMFPLADRNFAGDAPEVVQATFRMVRTKGPVTRRGFGAEAQMAPRIYDPSSPRKLTRLHVLGQKGARVLSGALHCRQWDYSFSNVFVQQRRDRSAAAVFPAIIEPYVGRPFITGCRLLAVADNDADARRAAAVEVKTANGHTDLLFADGRPDRTRKVAGGVTVSAEFAYVSTDAAGLRMAAVTGGTELSAPHVVVRPAARERTGRVTKVDYPNRTLTIDRPWPARGLGGRVFEIGVPGRMTSYTVDRVARDARASRITVTGGASQYLARVLEVEPDKQLVHCNMGMPFLQGAVCPGLDKRWVASNEEGTKFWRADLLGSSADNRRFTFKLSGAAVARSDFGSKAGFRLWEYGVGDRVRQSTGVSLRRVQPEVFELRADVAVTISLEGSAVMTSNDRRDWARAAGIARGPWVELAVPAGAAIDRPVYIKVSK